MSTGGDFHYREDGDPWEVETVYDNRYTVFAFILGILVGASIMATILL